MVDDTAAPLASEEAGYLVELVMALQPMGGHTLYDEDGTEVATVCGAHNVPPSVSLIRGVLQRASEAGVNPIVLYQRAVEVYVRLDADRRREHPGWTWQAPPFETVGPATWPPLKPDARLMIHEGRLFEALRALAAEPQRIERVRAVLTRAQARGVDPEALYRDVTARLRPDDSAALAARPYELVKPLPASGPC
jgi:hypothetical protein